jgi:hypothetical protein
MIKLENLNNLTPHPIFKTYGAIDHTHCKTSRTNLLQRENYRADKGHAYISTVITNRNGIICHFESGFRGATNDNRVVEMCKINLENKICGDKGFKNTHINIITPRDISSVLLRPSLNDERVVVEITNSCIKRYSVLQNNWLNQKPYLHAFVALACAQLTNLKLINSPIRNDDSIQASDSLLISTLNK